jgi:hypothetical protein
MPVMEGGAAMELEEGVGAPPPATEKNCTFDRGGGGIAAGAAENVAGGPPIAGPLLYPLTAAGVNVAGGGARPEGGTDATGAVPYDAPY